MKKNFKAMFIGIVIGVVVGQVFLTTVFSRMATVTKELFYNNIKINIAGNEIKPTDANGNYVEPFIIDGTTYLPVRGIANALDLEVDWDGDSNTVIIEKKNNAGNETDYAKKISWVCDHQNMAVIYLGTNYSDPEYTKKILDNYLDQYFPGLSEQERNIKWFSSSDIGHTYLFIPRYKAPAKIVNTVFNWERISVEERDIIGSVDDGAPFVVRGYSVSDGGPLFRVYYDGKECCTVHENLSGLPRLGFESKEILDLTLWNNE